MLDFVLFVGSGRVVGDGDFESGRGGKSCEFMFPEPKAVSVGSPAVGRDEEFSRIGIFFFVDTTLRAACVFSKSRVQVRDLTTPDDSSVN